MKLFIAAVMVFCLAVTSTHAQRRNPEFVLHDWRVLRVVDGDTIEFQATWVPAPMRQRILLRVYGVDTPEKGHRAKCPQEAQRGQAATEFVHRVIASSSTARPFVTDWDKYGGRVLGDVILDNNVSLRALLIQNGFARAYFGEAKQSWC
jgi:endonuclease YncB( thermonuclease family)